MTQVQKFMLRIGFAFLILIILVCVVAIFIISRYIVRPINSLSRAAADYKNNKDAFSGMKTKRSDEIGVLANSMTQMAKDIDGYVNDLVSARERADQMDRAANIDSLTKVRNKRAYDVEVDRLNRKTQPYGVVMIDLNGLKKINDTYGHEKGDISINTLCQIICNVFKHSPVYRIGGDEFVVILENNDYEERDNLIQEIQEVFRQNIDNSSLQPWERVSAAVGCAVYDPATDDGVGTVLARADGAMYENKRAMKENAVFLVNENVEHVRAL